MRIQVLRSSVVLALTAALATVGIAWAAPQDRPRLTTHRWVQQFGMVTPANGQTLRVHAVHLGLNPPPEPEFPAATPPGDPDAPPDPCRVVIAFFTSDGRIIGAPVARILEAGKSTFVDLNIAPAGDVLSPPDPCRASVWVFQTLRPKETPPDPCKATLELLDTATGRVSIHMLPAVQHALPAVQR